MFEQTGLERTSARK